MACVLVLILYIYLGHTQQNGWKDHPFKNETHACNLRLMATQSEQSLRRYYFENSNKANMFHKQMEKY